VTDFLGGAILKTQLQLNLDSKAIILRKITGEVPDLDSCALAMVYRDKRSNTMLSTGLSKVTVVDMFSFCREVCSVHLDMHPIELGGHGVVYSIEESCFSHKQKYQRGRAPEREIWVFGIVDTSFRPARAYLEVVEDRTQERLLPIINNVCRAGTIIHSDS
jgi:ISXO2-like transposase domain